MAHHGDVRDPRLSELGAALAEARRDRGMSQQDLADAIGVHRVTLARFERGKSDLGVATFLYAVETLGVPLVNVVGSAAPMT